MLTDEDIEEMNKQLDAESKEEPDEEESEPETAPQKFELKPVAGDKE
jgi:hypothetical protein